MEDPALNNPGGDAFKSLARPMGPNIPETGNAEFPSIHLHPEHVKGTKFENAEHGDRHRMEVEVEHHKIEGPKGKAHHHMKVLGMRRIVKMHAKEEPEKESKVKDVGGRLIVNND